MKFLRRLKLGSSFLINRTQLGRSLIFVLFFFSCKVASDSIVTGYDCTTTTNIQTFDLSVFRFTGSTTGDSIYFHCQAVVCLTSNTGSICTTQCNDCTAGGKRKKRGLGDHSRNDLAEENLVLGPYQIIDNVDNDDAVGDGRTKAEGMVVYFPEKRNTCVQSLWYAQPPREN